MTKSMDGRAVARENELNVLRALHRAGWLRTRDLAALVWKRWARRPSGSLSMLPPSATASQLRMAQRTIKRMKVQRLILSAMAPDGSQIHALAELGARRLQDAGVAASSGKDQLRTFSSGYYRHRCIANEIAVSGILQGYRVSTEREIARGLWAGGEAGIAGKRPDVLIRGARPSGGSAWFWVEVERSRRNAKDHAMLHRWLEHVRALGAPPLQREVMPGAYLAQVVFICTAAFEKKLRRELMEKKWKEIEISTLLSFNTSLYKFETINFA